MQVAAHPRRLTLGVSLATAGVIAVSPLAVSIPVVSSPAASTISSAAVRLAADYNPLQPWIDAFQTAGASAKQIGDSFGNAPAVLLQQFLANQAEHLGEVLKNPGSIGTVLGQVGHNIQAAMLASTLLGYNQDEDGFILSQQALDGWHEILRQSIPKILVEGTPPQAKDLIQQVLNVLSSPLSGVAIGLAGPLISPVVALVNSLHDVVAALVAGDFTTAVQNVINIPANVVGAALNGANMNLDGLVPVLNQMGLLAPGNTLNKLNIQFGGLFSAGVTGVYEDGIGGSIFNAIGLNTDTDMMGFPLNLDITGRALGPISALMTLGQIVAKAIGWDGTGNPLAPSPEQPATAETLTADEPAAELVSKATSTNESPSAIPSAATSAVSLTVSTGTVAGAGTSGSESTADESASGATADDASADDAKSDESSADDAKSDDASAEGAKPGSVGDADGVKSGDADADSVKPGSTTKHGFGKPAGKPVTAKKSTAGEGGADSGATSSAASDSNE
jgi:hypothetical protein